MSITSKKHGEKKRSSTISGKDISQETIDTNKGKEVDRHSRRNSRHIDDASLKTFSSKSKSEHKRTSSTASRSKVNTEKELFKRPSLVKRRKTVDAGSSKGNITTEKESRRRSICEKQENRITEDKTARLKKRSNSSSDRGNIDKQHRLNKGDSLQYLSLKNKSEKTKLAPNDRGGKGTAGRCARAVDREKTVCLGRSSSVRTDPSKARLSSKSDSIVNKKRTMAGDAVSKSRRRKKQRTTVVDKRKKTSTYDTSIRASAAMADDSFNFLGS